jgi:deoxycytidine triphosphate deaminase
MLSHRDLDARIAAGTVKLWYSFLPDVSGHVEFHPDELPVDISHPDSPATVFYRRNLYSSRLHLTVGPIVKTHQRLSVAGRKTYLHHKRCFDLREQNDAIVVAPYELLSIATNERIALDGKTSALVTPRITSTDSGLILSTAYIDPYYDGIMRVVLCNMTPERQTLRLLEPIAQCFFFDVPSDVDVSFKMGFAQKSVFYGQNWQRVLNSDSDPFPRRKIPIQEPSVRERLEAAVKNLGSLNAIQKFFTGAGILTVAGLLIGLGRFLNVTTNYERLRKDVDTLIQRGATEDEAAPLLGNRDIIIPAGAGEGRVRVNIAVASVSTPHVWLTIDRTSTINEDNVRLSYILMPGKNPSETSVDLIAHLKGARRSSEVRIPVLWMITR